MKSSEKFGPFWTNLDQKLSSFFMFAIYEIVYCRYRRCENVHCNYMRKKDVENLIY